MLLLLVTGDTCFVSGFWLLPSLGLLLRLGRLYSWLRFWVSCAEDLEGVDGLLNKLRHVEIRKVYFNLQEANIEHVQ